MPRMWRAKRPSRSTMLSRRPRASRCARPGRAHSAGIHASMVPAAGDSLAALTTWRGPCADAGFPESDCCISCIQFGVHNGVCACQAVVAHLPSRRSRSPTMTADSSLPTVHPVDQRLPSGKLAALGLQHVLVMYAGAVAVLLIVGTRAQAHARRGRAADLGRPLLLRHRHADPGAGRHAVLRHQAAGDDGRDFRVGRADGRHRQCQPRPERRAVAVRRHHRRGCGVDTDRAAGEPNAALLSAKWSPAPSSRSSASA